MDPQYGGEYREGSHSCEHHGVTDQSSLQQEDQHLNDILGHRHIWSGCRMASHSRSINPCRYHFSLILTFSLTWVYPTMSYLSEDFPACSPLSLYDSHGYGNHNADGIQAPNRQAHIHDRSLCDQSCEQDVSHQSLASIQG